MRRETDHLDAYRSDDANDKFFARTSSAIKDPGVVGPIVWNLRRQNFSAEGNSIYYFHIFRILLLHNLNFIIVQL